MACFFLSREVKKCINMSEVKYRSYPCQKTDFLVQVVRQYRVRLITTQLPS